MTNRNRFVGREELLLSQGVDIKKLHYVGLELPGLPVVDTFAEGYATGRALIPRDYIFSNDWRTWIAGPVGENAAHVTVKYGLLTPSYERKEVINELIGWPREDFAVQVVDVEVFPSTFDDLPYGCVVLRLGGDELLEMNAALSTLPHVDSFTSYKPHITLAYVSPEMADDAATEARYRWLDARLKATGIDYGKVYD